MVASTKAITILPVPLGSEKPSVVSDEALCSKARWDASLPVPQNTNVNAMTMKIIQTSGRLTSETGA